MTNDLLKRAVQEALRRSGNVSKVARDYDLNYSTLKKLNTSPSRVPKNTSGPPPEDISELGRPGLHWYVIAIKKDGVPDWPVKYEQVIKDAREKYDAGTHEMCQGLHESGYVVLYLIPRLTRRTTNLNYFSSMDEFNA